MGLRICKLSSGAAEGILIGCEIQIVVVEIMFLILTGCEIQIVVLEIMFLILTGCEIQIVVVEIMFLARPKTNQAETETKQTFTSFFKVSDREEDVLADLCSFF